MRISFVLLYFLIPHVAQGFCWNTTNNNNTISHQITIKDLEEFAQLYAQRPIKENSGGMKSVGMFWVWFTTKMLQPDLIIESGIWHGQSTWLLEQAAPRANIISIDINLDRLKYKSHNVTYTTTDFSQLNVGDITDLNTLCFFDDHQDAYARLHQAHHKGFKHILFDDNYPVSAGGHQTLAHCLVDKHKTQRIHELCDCYTMFPNIAQNITHCGGIIYKTEKLNLNIPPHLGFYKHDAPSYRWTTYVRLLQLSADC